MQRPLLVEPSATVTKREVLTLASATAGFILGRALGGRALQQLEGAVYAHEDRALILRKLGLDPGDMFVFPIIGEHESIDPRIVRRIQIPKGMQPRATDTKLYHYTNRGRTDWFSNIAQDTILGINGKPAPIIPNPRSPAHTARLTRVLADQQNSRVEGELNLLVYKQSALEVFLTISNDGKQSAPILQGHERGDVLITVRSSNPALELVGLVLDLRAVYSEHLIDWMHGVKLALSPVTRAEIFTADGFQYLITASMGSMMGRWLDGFSDPADIQRVEKLVWELRNFGAAFLSDSSVLVKQRKGDIGSATT